MKKSELLKKLSDRIVKLREAKGMTAEKLAFEIGFSKSGLRYIERNMKEPRYSTLWAIAKGLRISPTELFNFEEEKKS